MQFLFSDKIIVNVLIGYQKVYIVFAEEKLQINSYNNVYKQYNSLWKVSSEKRGVSRRERFHHNYQLLQHVDICLCALWSVKDFLCFHHENTSVQIKLN